MKRTITLGLLEFHLTFLVLAKDLADCEYNIDSIKWVDTGLELREADGIDMPQLLDSFEAYLVANLPALLNETTPEPYRGDYQWRDHYEKAASLRYDYYGDIDKISAERKARWSHPNYTTNQWLDAEIALVVATVNKGTSPY